MATGLVDLLGPLGSPAAAPSALSPPAVAAVAAAQAPGLEMPNMSAISVGLDAIQPSALLSSASTARPPPPVPHTQLSTLTHTFFVCLSICLRVSRECVCVCLSVSASFSSLCTLLSMIPHISESSWYVCSASLLYVHNAARRDVGQLYESSATSLLTMSLRPGEFPPANVYDKNGVRVMLHFSKTSPHPAILVAVVSFVSFNSVAVSAISFQAAVPKVRHSARPLLKLPKKPRCDRNFHILVTV